MFISDDYNPSIEVELSDENFIILSGEVFQLLLPVFVQCKAAKIACKMRFFHGKSECWGFLFLKP